MVNAYAPGQAQTFALRCLSEYEAKMDDIKSIAGVV